MSFIPIEKILDKSPVVMILRHAERHPVVDWQEVDKPLLTERGQKDSIRLGEQLAAIGPLRFFHSPVPRCRQTAEGISQGISSQNGRSHIVGSLSELTGKNIIKGNWNDIIPIVEKHGWPYFCGKWFDGEWPETLVMPLKQAAHVEVEFLLKQLEQKETSTINITHDFVISVLREYFFHIRFKDVGIPQPLDTIAVYSSNERMHLLYQEHECVVQLPLEQIVTP